MRLGGHIVCVWDPIADEMNKRLPKVNEEILKKDPLAKGKAAHIFSLRPAGNGLEGKKEKK